MKKTLLFLFLLAGITSNTVYAQDSFQPETYPTFDLKQTDEGEYRPKNIFKTNLLGIAFKNYTLGYERVLNKWFTAGIEVRMMPSTSLPFVGLIAKQNDELLSDGIKGIRMSGFGVTPEVRFYPSLLKGYGRGFYVGAFFRRSSYTIDNFNLNYNDQVADQVIKLKGKLTTNTAGIMIGKQWILGKHFVLDWIIMGVHYGGSSGAIDGYSSRYINPSEQEDVRKSMNDISIPYVKKEVSVDSHNANMKMTGPWLGLRSGFSIGFCF